MPFCVCELKPELLMTLNNTTISRLKSDATVSGSVAENCQRSALVSLADISWLINEDFPEPGVIVRFVALRLSVDVCNIGLH
jgi:hypothetical protein